MIAINKGSNSEELLLLLMKRVNYMMIKPSYLPCLHF